MLLTRDFLRRHRMGGADRTPSVGHHFGGWWKKHGEQHPDWFMMNEDGTRGLSKSADKTHVPMCVSNPELQRFIVENWNGKSVIRLGEVDWPDACGCPACRARDAPAPDPLPEFLTSEIDRGRPDSAERQRCRGHVHRGFYDPVCTSDRYARFWQTVLRLAARRNPEALVTTYIYYGYFPAPSFDIQLGRQVYGEFVPWGNPQHTDFLPMREEALTWLKQQWLGWQRTGIRLAYRPNYLHDGWVVPLVDTRQSGGFLRFAVENGMDHSRHFNDLHIDHGHRRARFRMLAHEAFPPACFEPAEHLLDLAAAAAKTASQPKFAACFVFLRDGLRHSQLAGTLAACFAGSKDIPKPSERFERAVNAMRELIAFRRAHEKPYISDYLYGGAWREQKYWNLRPIFDRLKSEQIIGNDSPAHDTAADATGNLP